MGTARRGSGGRRAALLLLALLAGCGGGREGGEAEEGIERGALRPRAGTVKMLLLDEEKEPRVAHVAELIRGKVSGVQVMSRGDGTYSLRVRGASTPGLANQEPLIVVDGYPSSLNGLDSVNPYDVVKIEVIKDMANAMEYGSRAGNGVIKITTQRGKAR